MRFQFFLLRKSKKRSRVVGGRYSFKRSDEMEVTILGFWGGYPYNNEGTTSFLLQSKGYSLLLDAGSATLIQLQKVMDPLELDSVILTHYHHDHIADLGVLQYLRQLKPTNNIPELLIYGHKEDESHFNQLTLQNVSKGVSYNSSESIEIGPFQISFLKTIHPVTCYAMRILEKETGKVFVFTGDTGYFDELIEFSKNADLLITDTYFLAGNENHHAHLTSKETAHLAKEAGVKQLVLSHLNQHIDLELLLNQTTDYLENKIPVQLAATQLKITI